MMITITFFFLLAVLALLAVFDTFFLHYCYARLDSERSETYVQRFDRLHASGYDYSDVPEHRIGRAGRHTYITHENK